jgi:hypothetical protein
MEFFAELFGGLTVGRRRTRRRVVQDEQERLAVSAPLGPGRDTALSADIPSALIPIDQRVRALAIGGAPAWSRRLKQIHDLKAAAVEQLAADWRTLALRHRRDPARFAADWRRHAEGFDLGRVNDLIARHNRHFPAEINLPMDVRTRDYVAYNGGDYRLERLTADWIYARFPPDLSAALAGAD